MTQLYRYPCAHPRRDIVAGEFRVRGIGRLCDVCLCLLRHEVVGSPPPDYAVESDGFKLDVQRARAVADVLGMVEPSLRELQLLPVAAAVVARCDDVLAAHARTYPAWRAARDFLQRGSTGDDDLDWALRFGYIRADEDCLQFEALVDRLLEEASA